MTDNMQKTEKDLRYKLVKNLASKDIVSIKRIKSEPIKRRFSFIGFDEIEKFNLTVEEIKMLPSYVREKFAVQIDSEEKICLILGAFALLIENFNYDGFIESENRQNS